MDINSNNEIDLHPVDEELLNDSDEFSILRGEVAKLEKIGRYYYPVLST